MCQDTGTAIIMGKKGQRVWTGGGDEELPSRDGVLRDAYAENNLRYSPGRAADDVRGEEHGHNLPAQIDLYSPPRATPTSSCSSPRAAGRPTRPSCFRRRRRWSEPTKTLMAFLEEKIRTLGTAACPPYHLAIVIGGTSAEAEPEDGEARLSRYLDGLPTHRRRRSTATPSATSRWRKVLKLTRNRASARSSAASTSATTSASSACRATAPPADRARRLLLRRPPGRSARSPSDGVFLEQLEMHPAKYLPEITDEHLGGDVVEIDLTKSMSEILGELTKHPIKTRLSLTGP
jgi:fumarate hydratase class I